MNEEYLLPDDYVEEDTTDSVIEVEEAFEEVEPDTTEETEPDAEPEATVEPIDSFELDYKFNHADGKLTDRQEAQRLVQLGLLYQSKEPEFNELKLSKVQVEKINQLAGMYGMTFDEMHETLYNQYLEAQSEATGYTPEQIRKERELADKEQVITAKEQAEQDQKKQTEMYDRFFQAYPGVDPKAISQETWQQVASGIDLISAYTMQVNKELKEQLNIANQNQKNKSTSPVVSTTKMGSIDPVGNDEFLEGFWGS